MTTSFFAFWDLFFLSSPQGRKIGKGQWEGVTVLSISSLRKKAFSAGSGGLKCQSRALWKCLPWPRGSTDPSTLFPSSALAKPQGLSGFPPLPCTGYLLLPQPSTPTDGEIGRPQRRKNQKRSDNSLGARQAWRCSDGLQGPSQRVVTWAPAGWPQLQEDALTLLQPAIKIQACYKKNTAFKVLIDMH